MEALFWTSFVVVTICTVALYVMHIGIAAVNEELRRRGCKIRHCVNIWTLIADVLAGVYWIWMIVRLFV